MLTRIAGAAVAVCVLLMVSSIMAAPPVHPRFDLGSPESAPFPSDRFTVPTTMNLTGLRIALPLPRCEDRPSDCTDVTVINTLDGFNVQPRLSIPFDGEIDALSVTSDTVFLLKLRCDAEDVTCDQEGATHRVGVDQVVWDTLTNTLHVESDELLDQHTRYALIVTRDIRDVSGSPIGAPSSFQRFRQTVRGPYKHALLDAVHAARNAGVREDHIAVASVFTTQSVTAGMEKIRDQIKAGPTSITDFALGSDGTRTVFPLSDVSSVSWKQQTGTTPSFSTVSFTLAPLRSVPGAVGRLAFGRFRSRDYEVHPGEYIPATATNTGAPAPTGVNDIYFNLVLPAGTPPPNGWPVAIFGVVGSGNKQGVTLGVASPFAVTLAQHGIALIAVNSVGHGFGPLGSLTVNRTTGVPVTFSSGGRGIDQDGDGAIADREGMRAVAPREIIDERDGFQQTVADLMQLVRQIEAGVDVDGDGLTDLDASRVYYASQSLGGMYGTVFLAVEPNVGAGVLNATGGPRTVRTLTPGRAAIGAVLTARVPSLINAPGITNLGDVPVLLPPHYNENLPLRGGESLSLRLADSTSQAIQSPVINTVPGAMEIQEYLERSEWVSQSANPVAYAPYLRRHPLSSVPKRVIVQFAKGDQMAPNPSTTALVRAGHLEDRTTYYRHDLAFAETPTLPKDPHGFTLSPSAFGAIARGAQEQIAIFFESDGELTIHPEPGRFFEVPIAGPLPEGLNFIP